MEELAKKNCSIKRGKGLGGEKEPRERRGGMQARKGSTNTALKHN